YSVFPGRVPGDSKACLDWAPFRLLAVSTHSYITIVDSATMARVQVLDAHPAPITRLKWHGLSLTCLDRLSGDQLRWAPVSPILLRSWVILRAYWNSLAAMRRARYS